jgi:hypothetical protein
MPLIRRAILAFALFAGFVPAMAQVPQPVPALPDQERRTAYSITGSTCACNVNFALYGDGSDYQNWLEVYLNGALVNYSDPTYGWKITSISGSLGSIALPITNAVLTFNSVQTGTVQIVGARRPRRLSQFTENQPVPARNLNQLFTDIIAGQREIWDKTNDFTGRALVSQPGVTLGLLPLPAVCAGALLGFDATGLKPSCITNNLGSGNVTLPVVPGNFAAFNGSTGLLKDSGVSSVASVNARALGIKQNGIAVAAGVTINSGSGALTATGATFTAADIGKYIMVPGAGTAGAYLVTTISTFTDATHVGLTANAGTNVSAAKTITYCSDDSSAIATAIATALTNGVTIVFTDGIACHSGTLNWAFNNLHVQFPTDNAVFIHTGTGVAHSFSGIANYPGTQGAVGGVFGGPGRPFLRGNPAGGTTACVGINNWHEGYMKAALHDCATGLLGTDTGIVGSSSVAGNYDIRISNNAEGAFIITPTRAIDWTAPVANSFTFVVEGAGATSNKCVYLTGAINNSWRGGTVESCVAGGIIEDSTSKRNTYMNVDVETNGSGPDWTENGVYPVLINCSGAGTTSGSTFGSAGAVLIGGKYQSVTINDNTLRSDSTEWLVTSTNNGSNTTILNGTGVGAPAPVEAAIAIIENKTCNTASNCVMKFNSKAPTDLSGPGLVLATSVGGSPSISSGFGGGTPTISAPNGTGAFRVTVGTASGSTGVLLLPTAPTGWNCTATDLTTKTTANASILQNASGSDTTHAAFTGYSDVMGTATWVANDVISFICQPF